MIRVQGSSNQDNIILNVMYLIIKLEAKLIELKELEKSTIITGDFSNHLSKTDRIDRKPVRIWRKDLNNTIKQLVPAGIY